MLMAGAAKMAPIPQEEAEPSSVNLPSSSSLLLSRLELSDTQVYGP